MAAGLRLTPTFFHLLLSLAEGPRHGYAMMREIEERTEGRVRLGPGSLYYALSRLEESRLIREDAGAGEAAPSGESPHEERRRYYALTPEGRERLREEMRVLDELVAYARRARLIP